MTIQQPTICVAGENALIVYFSNRADVATASVVAQTCTQLRDKLGTDQLIDLVPSYASLLVIYNALNTDHYYIRQAIRDALSNIRINLAEKQGACISLPAYYSSESGPDLLPLAQSAGLTVEEVIAIHQQVEYRVYAIGFAPGFAYLGEVDRRIAAPRLATPRQKVPRGAVAIADRQTAVYPAESPGGWNLIGLCPVPMFDPNKHPTMPVQAGDRVRFEAITKEQFLAMGGCLTELRSESP